MKARTIMISTTAFALALLLAIVVSAQDQVEPNVLARFEWKGEEITVTYDELVKEINELPRYRQKRYSTPEGKREYLTLMAESRLVLKAAEEKKYDADNEILEKLKKYVDELLVKKVTEEMVDSRISVGEEDMRAYFEENKEKFIEPEQVRLTCIATSGEKDKKEEAKKKAEEIFARIKAGEDIKAIAEEMSKKGENKGPGARSGGDTGFFSRDAFPSAEKFVEAAFTLQPGQMYDGVLELPLDDVTYYMIFRAEERKPERQKEFDEEDVQNSIRRELEKQQENKLTEEWVSSLKEKSKLKVYSDRIPENPDEAKDVVLAEFKWGGRKYEVWLSDVKKAISELSKYRQDRYKGKEGIEKKLNEMIEEALKLRDAVDKGYDVDFEIAKKSTEYLNQLMVEKIVKDEVDAAVTVSEEEKRAYYEAHKSDYIEPEKIRLTCITIQAEEGKEEEAKKRAEEMFARIKGGEDIKAIATELSEKEENKGPGGGNNGDTGFFSRSTFSNAEEFTEAAFSLQPGQMYDGILTQELKGVTYYMIFRAEERKPERQKEFDEKDVQRDVENKVKKENRSKIMDEWLGKLKKQAKFEVYPDRLPDKPSTESAEEQE